MTRWCWGMLCNDVMRFLFSSTLYQNLLYHIFELNHRLFIMWRNQCTNPESSIKRRCEAKINIKVSMWNQARVWSPTEIAIQHDIFLQLNSIHPFWNSKPRTGWRKREKRVSCASDSVFCSGDIPRDRRFGFKKRGSAERVINYLSLCLRLLSSVSTTHVGWWSTFWRRFNNEQKFEF